MTRMLAALTCWGCLTLSLVAQGQQPYRPTPLPLQGVVQGPNVFAVARTLGKDSDHLYLLQGSVVPGNERDTALTVYDLVDFYSKATYPMTLYPWRLRQDCFWSRGTEPMSEYIVRIPREDWKFLDVRTYEKEGWKELGKRYAEPLSPLGCLNIFPVPAKEVHGKLLQGRGALPGLEQNEMVGDYLPGEGHTGVLFTLVSRRMTAWRGKGTPPGKVPYWDFTWEKEEPFAAGFQEPFMALDWRGDWFFLTQSGKLYGSPRPAAGQGRKCVPAWADAARPVTALIADAGTGRTFFFCTDKGEAAGTYQAYFELSARPTPLPVRRGAIPVPPREANPLELVRPLAQFLVGQEHIRVR